MDDVREYANRDEWLASRRDFLGASEVAAALGHCPYTTPLELWSLKIGIAPDELIRQQSEAMYWGTALEPLIIQRFREYHDDNRMVMPWDQSTCVVHPEYKFLRATPDAMQLDDAHGSDMGTLQVKTAGHFAGKGWERGQIPLEYQIQVQAELAITGKKWGSIAVLIGGQKFLTYDFERDELFITAMLAAAQEFWRLVTDKEMPELDGSDSTSRILNQLHPNDNGQAVFLDGGDKFDAELRDIKAEIKALELRKTLIENRIKAAIGPNTYGVLGNGVTYSFKTVERPEHVVKATKYRKLTRTTGEKPSG